MKYIKQNIKQNAKRALSWLTALTLILALVPMFTINANASEVTQRTTALNFTSNNVSSALGTPGNPTTQNIDGSDEGWMWYYNGGAGYSGRVLVLNGLNLASNNNSLQLPPALESNVTIVLQGTNEITPSGTSPGIIWNSGNLRITGTGTLIIHPPTTQSQSVGIRSQGGAHNTSLTIDGGCTIDIKSGNRAIDLVSPLIIQNATLRTEALLFYTGSSGVPAVLSNSVTIERSHVTVTTHVSGGGTSTGIDATGGAGGLLTIRDSVVSSLREHPDGSAGHGLNAQRVIIENSHVTAQSGSFGNVTQNCAIRATSASSSLTIEDSTITAVGWQVFSHAPTFPNDGEPLARVSTTREDPNPDGALEPYTRNTQHQFTFLVVGNGGNPIAPGSATGAGSVRFTTPDFEGGNEPKEDVDVQARIVKLGADVYMIDIAWGNMKFVFDINSGEWDYDDREYAAGQGIWLTDNGEADEDFEGYLDGENNKVTVTNRSNNGVTAGFDFKLINQTLFNNVNTTANRVVGNFFLSNDHAQAGALMLNYGSGVPVPHVFIGKLDLVSADADPGQYTIQETLPSRSVWFAFSGTPDKGTFDSFQKAGIITVTITPETTP